MLPARTIIGVIAASAVFIVPASASAIVSVKVSPKKPIVDDSVTASFTVGSKLKSGRHYEALLVTATGDNCSSLVTKTTKHRPSKGGKVSFHFSPYDDKFNDASKWCLGKASVLITWTRDGDETGKSGAVVGVENFRFYRQP